MSKNLLFILGGGALLYWWWSSQSSAAPAAPTVTPAAGASPPAPTPTTGPTGTLAKIQAAIAAQNSSTFIYGQQSADTWNFYAMQAIPGWTAPSPESLYPGVPNAHMPVAFTDWWGRVKAFLPAGLSGYQDYFNPRVAWYGGWLQ